MSQEEVRIEGTWREGFVHWLLRKLQASRSQPSRMSILERLSLNPRQSLALVEVERHRFLIVTSLEGAPVMMQLGVPLRRSSEDHLWLGRLTELSGPLQPALPVTEEHSC